MLIALVRTKLIALLIGPTGVGLLGVFQSISGLTSTVVGLGLQISGVRAIAKSHGDGDAIAVAKTVTTLRRISWFSGLAGMFLLAIIAPWVSTMSFGSSDYTWSIAALGVTILLSNIMGGQTAILQGTRRVGDIARINVFGAILGSVISIAFYAVLGAEGIVLSLIGMAIVSLAFSTYYSRQINLPAVAITWKQSRRQSASLLRLGIAMVFSGIVAATASYIIRLLITRDFGLDGVGIFTAALNLSGIFVNFVLGAMGVDFYPRLTAVSADPVRMHQLINEQTEIGLLLAFPGLLATMVLAPTAIAVCYTSDFAPAAYILKWFLVGCMGQVLSWPLGFSLLAKGEGRLFVITETAFHTTHVCLLWMALHTIGLVGTGIAFTLANALYTFIMLHVTRNTIGFAWSRGVWHQLIWMAPLALIAILCTMYLPHDLVVPIGIIASLTSGVICIRQLVVRLESDHRVRRCISSLPGGHLLLRGLQQ